MLNDLFVKNSLAPLILRLALAAIFIYSGLEKVAARDINNWGAAWATNYWAQRAKPPEDVQTKFTQMMEAEGADKAKIVEVEGNLKTMYNREISVPGALQSHIAQIAVAWGELAAGLAMLLGVLARWAALGLIVIQIGAVVTVTWARSFSFAEGGGWGYNLAILAMCLAIMCLGSGPLSLGAVLKRKRSPAPQAPAPQAPAPDKSAPAAAM